MFPGSLCWCCQTSGTRILSLCLKAPAMMVRPSEHSSPFLVAYPLKSGVSSAILKFASLLRDLRWIVGFLLSWDVLVTKLVSLLVLCGLHTHGCANLIGRHDLVPGHLVSDLSHVTDCDQLERIPEELDRLSLTSCCLS